MAFINKLIRHISKKHFKMVRYYGIYARHCEFDKFLCRAIPELNILSIFLLLLGVILLPILLGMTHYILVVIQCLCLKFSTTTNVFLLMNYTENLLKNFVCIFLLNFPDLYALIFLFAGIFYFFFLVFTVYYKVKYTKGRTIKKGLILNTTIV